MFPDITTLARHIAAAGAAGPGDVSAFLRGVVRTETVQLTGEQLRLARAAMAGRGRNTREFDLERARDALIRLADNDPTLPANALGQRIEISENDPADTTVRIRDGRPQPPRQRRVIGRVVEINRGFGGNGLQLVIEREGGLDERGAPFATAHVSADATLTLAAAPPGHPAETPAPTQAAARDAGPAGQETPTGPGDQPTLEGPAAHPPPGSEPQQAALADAAPAPARTNILFGPGQIRHAPDLADRLERANYLDARIDPARRQAIVVITNWLRSGRDGVPEPFVPLDMDRYAVADEIDGFAGEIAAREEGAWLRRTAGALLTSDLREMAAKLRIGEQAQARAAFTAARSRVNNSSFTVDRRDDLVAALRDMGSADPEADADHIYRGDPTRAYQRDTSTQRRDSVVDRLNPATGDGRVAASPHSSPSPTPRPADNPAAAVPAVGRAAVDPSESAPESLPAAHTDASPPREGPWTRRIQIEVTGSTAVVSGTDRGDPPVLRQALKDNGFRWRPQGQVWRFVARRGGPGVSDAVQAIRDTLAELDTQEAAKSDRDAAGPSFPPTPQQQAIIDACLDGRDVAVRALAGTGKTSTMRMVAARMPDKKITYIAFNRSIADEAQAAFGRNVRADTMHAFARQALRSNERYQAKLNDVATNDGFPTEIAAVLGLGADDSVSYGPQESQTIEALSLVRMALGAVKGFRESAATELNLQHVVIQQPGQQMGGAATDPPGLSAVVLDYARRIWTDKASPTGALRFTHDDYLKIWALGNPTIPGDVIIFDEVQDVNELQARLVQAQDAQTIVVGDSYQSIYGFRGARDFLRSWPADVTLPLTQSWRFGPAVAGTGNRFLQLLRSPLQLEGNPALDTRLERVDSPDAVLCRTNAGAVAEVFAGLEEGKRVALVGGGGAIKDIARAAKDLQRGRSTRHPDLAAFASWHDVREYVNQHEDAQSLRMFVQLVDRHGPDGLIAMANDLVDEDETDPQLKAELVVSTAHKAKGREWPNVRIADDFRGPTEDPENGETALPSPEELRLAYVTVTRAQRRLDLGSLDWVLDHGEPSTEPTDTPTAQRQAHQEPSAQHTADTSAVEAVKLDEHSSPTTLAQAKVDAMSDSLVRGRAREERRRMATGEPPVDPETRDLVIAREQQLPPPVVDRELELVAQALRRTEAAGPPAPTTRNEHPMMDDLRREIAEKIAGSGQRAGLAAAPGVHLRARVNQQQLTQADRDAAIRLGGEDRHTILIEPCTGTQPTATPTPQQAHLDTGARQAADTGNMSGPAGPEGEPSPASAEDLPRTVLVDQRPMWVRGRNDDGTVDLYDLDRQTSEAVPLDRIELNDVSRADPIRLPLSASEFDVATYRFEDVRSGDPAEDETLGAELDIAGRQLIVFHPAEALATLDNALDVMRGNIADRAGDRDELRRWRQEERVTRRLREKITDLTVLRTGEREPDEDSPEHRLPPAPSAGQASAADPASEQTAAADSGRARFRPSNQQDLAPSGATARVRANIAALQTLRSLQGQQRPATAEEQRVLARWSGWGAVPQVFDDTRAEFAWAREQLAELLSPAELDAAMRNTLNAHYTDHELVTQIWSALGQLGFTGGRVLEPGCGSGNFIGAAPAGAQVVGVELDPVTAGIAAALYPDAQIRAESFADTRAPEGSFDLTVGNVPFAKAVLSDRQHNAGRHSIHNHFILKSLRLTAPGGLVAVITSRYTLDAQNPAARRETAQLADLVGAIRLPRAAHQQAAGTRVVTDLLVFRRREHDFEPAPVDWELTEVVDLDGQHARVNGYFIRHPEMVCGDLAVAHGQYSDAELTVLADRPAPELLSEKLRILVDHARAAELTHAPTGVRPPPRRAALVAAPIGATNGHLLVDGDGFAQVHEGGTEPFTVAKNQHAELPELLGLRDTVVGLLEAEAASLDSTPQIEQLRAQLNTRYDAYIARYGPLNRFSWRRTGRVDEAGEQIRARVPAKQGGFRTDPASPLVYALENFDPSTQRASKADIFTQRVVAPRAPRLGADSPEDALAICMDTRGRVDLDEIARLLGLTVEETRDALGQLVFADPAQDGQLVPAAEYLSGQVRDKLAAAREAAADDPRYEPNVDALAEVIPPDIAAEDIVARLGSVWIDQRYIQQFLREVLADDHLVVEHAYGAHWKVVGNEASVTATSTWGTPDYPAPLLAQALLEQRAITVHDEIEVRLPGGGTSTRRRLNLAKTVAAQAKADEFGARFSEWVWEDPQRATDLARTYNDRFNSLVLRSYDDVELSLPGLALTFTPAPHQIAAVARMRAEPAVGLYHEVGAGKTAEMAMGVMELRRLGMVRKPAIVVPNHMLEQFTREFQQLYPRAKLLAASSNDLTRDKRRAFVARVATNDWDAVIMTRTAFQRIPMSPKAQADYLHDQLAEMRAAVDRQKGSGQRSYLLKRMQNQLLVAEEKIKDKLASDHDPAVMFEQSGIDYVVVDEAHDYKNLRTASNIPGATIEGSERASDLEMKLHYLRRQHGDRVATFATATPIANSITEAHVMQRYLRPDLLEAAGVRDFDAWAATFGRMTTEVELSPDATSFRIKTRFAKFHNVPEQLRMWRVSSDVKTAKDLNLPRPELSARPTDGQRLPQTELVAPSAELQAYIKDLGQRAQRVSAREVEPHQDNMLLISSNGRAAALDMRLVDQPMPPGESKIDAAAEKIAQIWARHRTDRFTDPSGAPHPVPGALQIVFCDLGTPRDDRWNAYDELRDQLVKRGLPAEKVRFIHEARNDREKAELFQACRTGGVHVLIGSTGKMGVGTNVQTRAVALHHLDCPWRPADLAQRDGRALRRGNQYPEISIYRWVTEGSFDAYSWQTVARKAGFIAQVMRGRLDVREIEDIGDAALSYNEVKALAAGNPLLLDKAKADAELTRLERLERSHIQTRSRLRYAIEQHHHTIEHTEREITTLEQAIAQRRDTRGDRFHMVVDGRTYTARADAGEALRDLMSRALDTIGSGDRVITGVARLGGLSFDTKLLGTYNRTGYELTISGIPHKPVNGSKTQLVEGQPASLPVRLENRLAALDRDLTGARAALDTSRAEIARATAQLDQPFPHRAALEQAHRHVADLDRQLDELAAEPAPEAGTDPTEAPAKQPPAHQHDPGPTAAAAPAARAHPAVAAARTVHHRSGDIEPRQAGDPARPQPVPPPRRPAPTPHAPHASPPSFTR